MSSKCFLRILLVGLIAGTSLPGADPTDPPPAPATSLTEIGETFISLEGATLSPAKWQRGALVVLERGGASPLIHGFDREGKRLSRVPFSIPGATDTKVGAFARASDGTLAVIGSAYTSDRGTTFLAVIAPDGQSQKIVRLKPFAPHEVTAAPDGTFWVVGTELVNGREVSVDHHVLRRYSPSGGELGGYLPRSTLPPGGDPTSPSFLVSSVDRIGWYSLSSRLYIELSLDGDVLARVAGLPRDDRVTGVALCDDGSVFVSVTRLRDKPARRQIFALDRAGNSWEPVPESGDSATMQVGGYLCGCEGSDLVTRKRPYLKFFRRLSVP